MATVPVVNRLGAGAVLRASAFNSQIAGGVAYLKKPPNAYAYQSGTGTTLPSGVFTPIPFNSETADEDLDAMHSTVTLPTRMTAVTPGLYALRAQLAHGNAIGPTHARQLRIMKNGATQVAFVSENGVTVASPLSTGYLQINGLVPLSVGDYVEVSFSHSGGATTSVTGRHNTFFSARWVASP